MRLFKYGNFFVFTFYSSSEVFTYLAISSVWKLVLSCFGRSRKSNFKSAVLRYVSRVSQTLTVHVCWGFVLWRSAWRTRTNLKSTAKFLVLVSLDLKHSWSAVALFPSCFNMPVSMFTLSGGVFWSSPYVRIRNKWQFVACSTPCPHVLLCSDVSIGVFEPFLVCQVRRAFVRRPKNRSRKMWVLMRYSFDFVRSKNLIVT